MCLSPLNSIRAFSLENMIQYCVPPDFLEHEFIMDDLKATYWKLMDAAFSASNDRAVKWIYTKSQQFPLEYAKFELSELLFSAAKHQMKTTIQWLILDL